MKLLVFSDSHKNVERMEFAVRKENPDAIIHLGDNIADAIELQSKVPEAVIYMIAGNCDMTSTGKRELLLSLENVNILLTHGHQYSVKTGLSKLALKAVDLSVNLVLYGHTHNAEVQTLHGVTLMNPGQLERNDSYSIASYGIVEIEDSKFNCEIVYFDF